MNATGKPSFANNRVVLFGTLGVYSHAILAGLLSRAVNVCGIVVYGTEPNCKVDEIAGIPIEQTPNHATIETLAVQKHIPIIYEMNTGSSRLQQELEKLRPDYVLVGCFPNKIPSHICDMPRIAALNVHPSMLPTYRGPNPIFWQLKNGETKTGVTIHLLSEEFDAGDIVLQNEISIRPGMRGRAIDAHLGDFGAKLAYEVMRLYQVKNINPKPQEWLRASYMPAPTHDDFEISINWSARQAFSFMRGTEEWGKSYPIKVGNSMVYAKNAMAYSPSGSINQLFTLDDNYITMQFSPGLVNAYIEAID